MGKNWGVYFSLTATLFSSFTAKAEGPAGGPDRVSVDCAERSVIGSAPCAHVKNFIATEIKNRFVEELRDYYHGLTKGTAGARPHQMPVCNFTAGEGSELSWARSAQNIDYSSNSVKPPAPDLRASGAKNYNFLKTDPHYLAAGGSYVNKDISWCGTFCTFHVDVDYLPPGAEVSLTGGCGREYAYFRGLWPQSYWKHTEAVISELESGDIRVTSGSVCQDYARDLVAQHTKLLNEERTFTEKVQQERGHSATYQIPHCADLVNARRKREPRWQPTADEIQTLATKMIDGGFSQPVCLLQSERINYYKSLTDLAHCEASVRARAQVAPQMTTGANEAFITEVKDKIVAQCESDEDSNINSCYRREFALAMERHFGASNPAWRSQSPVPTERTVPRHSVNSLLNETAPTLPDVKTALSAQLVTLRRAISGGR